MNFDFLIREEIDRIIEESGFVVDKEIYKSEYYRKNKVRNIIFDGKLDGKEAILKIWKDPRKIFEPLMLKDFLKKNKSSILLAPKLYNYKMFSDHFGWLIEEKIDVSKNIFKGLASGKERKEFIKIFKIYKKNWPKKPPIKMKRLKTIFDYNLKHISKWKNLAEEKKWLKQTSYKMCDEGLNVLRKFADEYKFCWIHGHFKPKEIFKIKNKYYLTDFAHCDWRPEFVEGPFAVWSIIQDSRDVIDLDKAIKESLAWKKLFVRARFIDERGFDLGMIERSCGAILADIGGSDISINEKKKLLEIWTGVLKYYLNKF